MNAKVFNHRRDGHDWDKLIMMMKNLQTMKVRSWSSLVGNREKNSFSHLFQWLRYLLSPFNILTITFCSLYSFLIILLTFQTYVYVFQHSQQDDPIHSIKDLLPINKTHIQFLVYTHHPLLHHSHKPHYIPCLFFFSESITIFFQVLLNLIFNSFLNIFVW